MLEFLVFRSPDWGSGSLGALSSGSGVRLRVGRYLPRNRQTVIGQVFEGCFVSFVGAKGLPDGGQVGRWVGGGVIVNLRRVSQR